jgi:hypothetical protein
MTAPSDQGDKERLPQPEDQDPTLGGQDLDLALPDFEPSDPRWEEPDRDLETLLTPEFDIDDTIRGSRTIGPFGDRSSLVISFQAFIDWKSGTKLSVSLKSRTLRTNPGTRVYSLNTSFRMTLLTEKLGRTQPPMEVFPMEDDRPTYGLNVYGASLRHGFYGPGSVFSVRSNDAWLAFSGTWQINGTGEPLDNKITKITVYAYGGFTGSTQYATAASSAIRGGA